MSQLSFRLFGSPQIEIDGRPVDFGRHKAMALCAYLAVTAQPHRRDTLATLFWPWQDQSSARGSLRRVLHTATRAVGSERFALTRETIGLVQGPDLWVDVLQFRQAVEASGRAPSGQQADAARMGKLSAATDLYRGDFLAGFTLRDTPDFDTWQYITAQDLRRSAVSLLQQLAEFHLECAEFEPAITFAQHWLSLDPLDERAHRTLIRLHAGAGNRTQALHQYDQCCRLLENELGVTPEPETIDLIDDVRTNRFAVASAAESGSSTTPVVELGNADPQTDPQTIPTAAPYPVAQPILSEIRTLTALSLAVEYGEEEVAATSPHAETAGLEEFKQAVHTLSESVDAAIDHLGSDGGLLFFGLSRSHEDDAERALHVAFELVRLAAECHIRIAIGIKSGEASVSGDDLPVVGGSLASRTAMLQRKAALGQVLVDRHTWRRTRDAYHMAPLSTAERAQGVGGPVYIAGGPMAQPLKSRGILGLQSELIGREYELAGLLADCREISDGRGKLVFVIGSAGVGKSRLIGELREALERAAEDDPSPLWLEGRCLEMSVSTGYAPFRAMIGGFFSRDADVDPSALATHVEASLKQMACRHKLDATETAEMGAALGGLLSIHFGTDWDERLNKVNAAQVRARTMAAIQSFLRVLAAERPLILVIDDVHWADDLSTDLLVDLMTMVTDNPVLLLCVLRPDPADRLQQLTSAAANKCPGNYREIRLHELSPEQNRQMIASLLKVEALSSTIRDWILTRTQGNPFFTEEVVRALIDAGIIVRGERGWHSSRQEDDESAANTVPYNIDSLIHSRVDRLAPDSRRHMQIAAALGRTFSLSILERLVDDPAVLADDLQLFQQRGFIYLERSGPEPEYSFQHVLTQEAVYRMLPQDDRFGIHGEVVKAIESIFADQLDAKIEILAHHAARTQDHTRASLYLARAAEKARRSYLNQDAIRLFEQALERLKLLDQGDQSSEFGQRQAHLFYQLGRAYYAEGQFDLAESALREAIAVGQASEIEMRTLARYYYWLGEALFWQNHAVELLEMAREGLAQLGTEVETVGGAMLTGHLAIATAFLFGQKPFVAIAERLAGFIRDLPFSEELSPAFHHAIDASTFAKNVERALELINALENRSRQNNDLNSLAKALFIRGRLAKMTGDFVASIAPLQEALRLTGKTGEATMQGFALEALLMDYCLLGRIDEARYWAEQIDDSGSQLGAWIDLMRGTVFLCAGDTTVAGQRLIRCMQDSRRTGLMNSLATHLTIGRCLMAEGKFDEAGRRMLAVLESADAYRELASNVPELKPALPGCLSLLQEAMGDEEGFNRVCNQLQQQIHVGSPHFTQWRLTPAAPSALAGPAIATVFDRSLTGPWIWHDPYGDCCHRLHDGLIIEAADARDLWFVNYSAPRFTQRVEGDLAAEATCSPADDGRPTMGGLVIWFDRSNFVRMDRGAHGKNEITFLGCVDNENAIFGRGRLPGERITLRLERIGDQIRALCRVPDQQWFTVGSVNVPFEGPYEIGIFACGYVDRTIYPGTPAGGGSLRFESFQLCGK